MDNKKYKINVIALCFLLWAHGYTMGQVEQNNHGAAARDYIRIYQKYLSGLKASHCPMYPTCSQYGMMVFSDHSFAKAMVHTADRLLRCGNHADFYPKITEGTPAGQLLDYPPSRDVPANIITTSAPTVAAETIIPTDSTQNAVQFINHLINQHIYASALLEIERLLYYDTAFLDVPELYLDKMRCYEGLKRYSEGLLFFEQSIPVTLKANNKIVYMAAHLYNLVGDYTKSISLYQQSSVLKDSNDVHPFTELAVLYAREELFDKSRSALECKLEIDKNHKSYENSVSVLAKMEKFKYKNPTTAMLLSIVPGIGYLYTCTPKNAIVSIIVNSLLAYTVYTSLKVHNWGLGIIMGAFSVSFYGGNIVGSGVSAKRYNEKIKNDAIAELKHLNPFYY